MERDSPKVLVVSHKLLILYTGHYFLNLVSIREYFSFLSSTIQPRLTQH